MKTDNHLQFLGSLGVMFMFCKVNFQVERSATQIYVHWVYILVIRSPVDSSSWGIFVCGPLQLTFFCYTRGKVPSSNSIVGGLTQDKREQKGVEKNDFFHKSMRYFTVKETLFIKDEALLTIFSSSAHDRMIPFP